MNGCTLSVNKEVVIHYVFIKWLKLTPSTTQSILLFVSIVVTLKVLDVKYLSTFFENKIDFV